MAGRKVTETCVSIESNSYPLNHLKKKEISSFLGKLCSMFQLNCWTLCHVRVHGQSDVAASCDINSHFCEWVFESSSTPESRWMFEFRWNRSSTAKNPHLPKVTHHSTFIHEVIVPWNIKKSKCYTFSRDRCVHSEIDGLLVWERRGLFHGGDESEL